MFAQLADLSHRAAAKALNERGIKTATGKAWTAIQVIRVRERLADRSVESSGLLRGDDQKLTPAVASPRRYATSVRNVLARGLYL